MTLTWGATLPSLRDLRPGRNAGFDSQSTSYSYPGSVTLKAWRRGWRIGPAWRKHFEVPYWFKAVLFRGNHHDYPWPSVELTRTINGLEYSYGDSGGTTENERRKKTQLARLRRLKYVGGERDIGHYATIELVEALGRCKTVG